MSPDINTTSDSVPILVQVTMCTVSVVTVSSLFCLLIQDKHTLGMAIVLYGYVEHLVWPAIYTHSPQHNRTGEGMGLAGQTSVALCCAVYDTLYNITAMKVSLRKMVSGHIQHFR